MISIIIPTLNEEKLLPQLLAQMCAIGNENQRFEIILSDGGSSDGTLESAAAFPVQVVTDAAEGRQTIARGRNIGAEAAAGDIFVFINADVRFDDFGIFLDAVERVFLPGTAISGATCNVQVFPEDERWSDMAFHTLHNLYVRFLNAIGEGMGRGECQVLRKSLFDTIGGYTGAMAAGEDYDLFRRVRRHGSIIMLPGVVLYESPRRFRKYGYLRIIWGWTRNALSVVWRNKSSSEEWEPVR